jgi:hypothetical protein
MSSGARVHEYGSKAFKFCGVPCQPLVEPAHSPPDLEDERTRRDVNAYHFEDPELYFCDESAVGRAGSHLWVEVGQQVSPQRVDQTGVVGRRGGIEEEKRQPEQHTASCHCLRLVALSTSFPI